MRATCAKPASPLAENVFSPNQSGKLGKIRDNYPKYILTRNDPIQQRNGIIHRNLPEFMRASTAF